MSRVRVLVESRDNYNVFIIPKIIKFLKIINLDGGWGDGGSVIQTTTM